MKITLGRSLDRQVLPFLLKGREATLSESVLGETGFLNALEVMLGTRGPELSSMSRLLGYRDALESGLATQPFYAASFKTDELAVANHLLALRDELVLGGWSGSSEKAAKGRLADLAILEEKAVSFEGLPDRVNRLLIRLKEVKVLPLLLLEVLDPIESWPKQWRAVFEALSQRGVQVKERVWKPESVSSASDLKALKEFTYSKKTSAAKGDGSVGILQMQDPWQSARWLAAWFAGRTAAENARAVIVAPPRVRSILSSAFVQLGIPFGAAIDTSSWGRPALQILLLGLSMLWKPQDPEHAAALLLVPGSPMPRKAAYKLLRALRQAPAVNGPEWEEAIAELVKKLKEEGDSEFAEKAEARAREWFPQEAASREDGIDPEKLVEGCLRIAKWAGAKGELQEKRSFLEMAGLARSLANAVAHLGSKAEKNAKLSLDRFERILMEVAGEGISGDSEIPRAGGPLVVSGPEAVLAPSDTVIWWDFSNNSRETQSSCFWSASELDDLEKAGVTLISPSSRALHAGERWLRPISMVTKQLLFVSFETDSNGEPESPHPLLDRILPFAGEERQQWLSQIMIHPRVSTDPATVRFEKEAGVEFEKPTPVLKPVRGEWKVERKLAFRPEESPSSLERALGCLLSYTLHYGADLSSGGGTALPGDAQLHGTLAHKVFEELFRPGAAVDPGSIRKIAEEKLTALARETAPALLETANRWEFGRLKDRVGNAARSYALFLQENDLEVAGVEQKCTATLFKGVQLAGRFDHLLIKKSEKTKKVIIDHKLGGGKYKQEDLREGRAIQLVFYSFMEKVGAEFPLVGYHIIEDGKVHLQDRDCVPLREVFEKAQAALQARAKALADGKVTADGLDEESQEWNSACRFCEYQLLCGKIWEET